ncbi:hypothetical protein [Ferrimonas kyonanensis]|uniref:hypothetical protein n=1 Tax=Ferrimonas kyonanensis TaxID=364763 RepID=UPI00041DFD2B|nr:hypothetical protein [Ferrimonas kyonanensis]
MSIDGDVRLPLLRLRQPWSGAVLRFAVVGRASECAARVGRDWVGKLEGAILGVREFLDIGGQPPRGRR